MGSISFEGDRWETATHSEAGYHRAPVAQLVEHRTAMREVVSSTPAGPTNTQGL